MSNVRGTPARPVWEPIFRACSLVICPLPPGCVLPWGGTPCQAWVFSREESQPVVPGAKGAAHFCPGRSSNRSPCGLARLPFSGKEGLIPSSGAFCVSCPKISEGEGCPPWELVWGLAEFLLNEVAVMLPMLTAYTMNLQKKLSFLPEVSARH